MWIFNYKADVRDAKGYNSEIKQIWLDCQFTFTVP